MSLYQPRAGKHEDDGTTKNSAPFLFLIAPKYLEDHPKFDGLTAEEELELVFGATNGKDNKDNKGGSAGGASEEADMSEAEKRGTVRPRGFKSMKREDKRKKEEGVVAVVLGEIRDEMKRANTVMEKAGLLNKTAVRSIRIVFSYAVCRLGVRRIRRHWRGFNWQRSRDRVWERRLELLPQTPLSLPWVLQLRNPRRLLVTPPFCLQCGERV